MANLGLVLSSSSTQIDVSTALQDVATVLNQALGVIIGQPVLLVFIGASLVGVGFRIFRMAKGSAR